MNTVGITIGVYTVFMKLCHQKKIVNAGVSGMVCRPAKVFLLHKNTIAQND
ncbi:hypothetical protein SAMN05421821_11492 [Mucilaginibacter lappiensis]|uniref:Uncharacterized protein n=1 Tax=Mucilaginibacter lappiensis TaxID=354630 RepID=A0ABR6PRL4_9SPHI|nr:hypothetical protein [Mucilaginibacter lappiensis]SIR87972.1 hypothetical protein SAMN05421821_11492 [Mucilaginibacter lappiensis]